MAHLAQINSFAFHKIDQTTGRCHQNVSAARQEIDLAHNGLSTNNGANAHMGFTCQIAQVVRYLVYQFTRRRKDQSLDRFWRGLVLHRQQMFNQRQPKGQRFTGTRLRKS